MLSKPYQTTINCPSKANMSFQCIFPPVQSWFFSCSWPETTIINSNTLPQIPTEFLLSYMKFHKAGLYNLYCSLNTIVQVSIEQAIFKWWLFQPKVPKTSTIFPNNMTISLTTIATTCVWYQFLSQFAVCYCGQKWVKKKKIIWLTLLEESQRIKLNHCRNLKTGAKDYHRPMLLTSLLLRACSCFRTPAQGVPPLPP